MLTQELTKSKTIDIYDYDDRIRRTNNLIKRDLSNENQDLLKKYDTAMITQGLGKAARLKNLQIVLNLSRFLRKNWKDATRNDIEKLVTVIANRYSDSTGQETYTTYDHKKILKIFFRWLKLDSREQKEVGDPPETKGIRMRKVKDKISREDLLTEADRTKLLHACGENARDRAFIHCHFDAATRPGEILNLKIKHVTSDKYGPKLKVDGKTGARPIRLIESTPSLAAWLNVHPFRNNPDAPLWINLSSRNYGKPLTYAAACAMVKTRSKKAALSKRVYLNLFRHTRATQTAQFLNEANMRKRHGWTPYSKMPGRYVHMNDADVDQAILSHYGLQEQEEKERKLPKICQICEMPNAHDTKICSKCGRPLDLETALRAEEKEKQEFQLIRKELHEQKIATLKLIGEAIKNPERFQRQHESHS